MILLPWRRFVVLVAGTVIYGKGDEAQQKQELEELEAAGELSPDRAAEFAASAPMFAPTAPMRSGAMAMSIPSSFKVNTTHFRTSNVINGHNIRINGPLSRRRHQATVWALLGGGAQPLEKL